MSTKTEVTCDGCGVKRTGGVEQHVWLSYFGAKSGDLCPTCVRVAFSAVQEPTLAKDASSPAHMREHIKDLAKQLAEQATAREAAERSLEQAARRVEFLSTVERELNEKRSACQTLQSRSDYQHDVIQDLLVMLGKKAERRNVERLREIRSAVASGHL